MTMPLSKALKEWEAKSGVPATEAKEIMLYGGLPMDAKRVFIKALDGVINTLKDCERLALSTNCIDRMVPLAGMEKLRLLSLGRNQIKKLEGLGDVAGTLEELWISYNQISSLDGLQPCVNLRVLYMANNALKDWSELDKIAGLPHLREVLFIGNPIYEGMDRATAKMQVLKRLPRVAKVDNEMVIDAEREAAAKL